jgi:hypothetical protein
VLRTILKPHQHTAVTPSYAFAVLTLHRLAPLTLQMVVGEAVTEIDVIHSLYVTAIEHLHPGNVNYSFQLFSHFAYCRNHISLWV